MGSGDKLGTGMLEQILGMVLIAASGGLGLFLQSRIGSKRPAGEKGPNDGDSAKADSVASNYD